MQADLRASSMTRDSGLLLNCDKRIVGLIPNVYIGDFFYFSASFCVDIRKESTKRRGKREKMKRPSYPISSV